MTSADVRAGTTELGYIPNLDALRGIAVSLVLFSHFFVTPVDNAGGVGVTLFFVLSGFLITRLLLEEQDRGGIDVQAFYGRRARRLLPALPLALALCVAVNEATGRAWGLHLFGAVTYSSNFTKIADMHNVGAFTHLWSLAVEEHFYIMWPVVMAALRRRWLLPLCVTVAVAVLAIRLPFAGDYRWAHHATWFRVDAMAIGAALAAVFGRVTAPRRLAVWASVAIGAVFSVHALRPAYLGAGLTLVAVASAVLVAAAVLAEQRQWGWLGHVGRISYGLYLLHMPIAVALRGTPIVVRGLGVVVSWLLAEWSYRVIESRFRSGRLDEPHRKESAVVAEGVSSVATCPAYANR